MTIASTLTRVTYAGNGSTSQFAVPFMFTRNSDIEVVISSGGMETVRSDYTLSGAGNPTGGVCAMASPPQAGETLVIRRVPAIVQEVDYVENDAFPAATHEAALDKLTMICQALSERLDRTITFRVSSAVTGVELPEPEAGRMLAWNDEGSNLSNRDLAQVGAVLLPLSVENGGTGGETPEQALNGLGFGSVGRALAGCDNQADALYALGDGEILLADQSAEVTAGFTLPETLPAAANPPLVSSGRVQALDVSGTVNLAKLTERGSVILKLTGAGTLNLHADYIRINGSEEIYAGADGLLMLVNDGTDQWFSLTNKGA
ncbi:phage tail fiber protein [uncultured Pseudodesulfovibrio sp.]|uniref:phage tail fiber protein n=1 Tax=uncultured Pseudodesulfovibrio sp. TaxID=2035858 RepID=UPI0029C7A027|nr:phage tail fiber protein [uncultured Pseudodesulfovibrio sp.]